MHSTSTRTAKGPLRSPMHLKIFVKNIWYEWNCQRTTDYVRCITQVQEPPKGKKLCPIHSRVRTAMYLEKVKIFISQYDTRELQFACSKGNIVWKQ